MITWSLAVIIARDQNNKATASMTRARQNELGITEAIWVHSGAGKHPRPTHVAMNGAKYDVKKGMWDPAVKRWEATTGKPAGTLKGHTGPVLDLALSKDRKVLATAGADKRVLIWHLGARGR